MLTLDSEERYFGASFHNFKRYYWSVLADRNSNRSETTCKHDSALDDSNNKEEEQVSVILYLFMRTGIDGWNDKTIPVNHFIDHIWYRIVKQAKKADFIDTKIIREEKMMMKDIRLV